MSGGSFDYLYAKDIEDLFRRTDLLEEMRDYLLEKGHWDAAAQTDAVLQTVKMAEKLIEARRRAGLNDVWRAAEWLRSCDWGPEQLAEAVDEWREGRSAR